LPRAIAAGQDGNLWFTEANGIGRITTATGPAAAILTRRARLSRRGVTSIKLSCEAGPGRCTGQLLLTASIRVRVHRRHHRRISKTITLTKSRFSLSAGQTAPINVTLSHAACRSLAQATHRRINSHARAISTGGDARRNLTLIKHRQTELAQPELPWLHHPTSPRFGACGGTGGSSPTA